MATPAAETAMWTNLRLTVVSAENLEDVRRLGKLKVYAKVSLDERPGTVSRSNPDMKRRSNPRWNFHVDYMINLEALQRQPQVTIVVELKCERSLGENRHVGGVRIGVRELFEMGMRSENAVSYPVEDCPDGRLHVMYSFTQPEYFILPVQNQTSHNQFVSHALDVGYVARTLVEGALVIFNGVVVLARS